MTLDRNYVQAMREIKRTLPDSKGEPSEPLFLLDTEGVSWVHELGIHSLDRSGANSYSYSRRGKDGEPLAKGVVLATLNFLSVSWPKARILAHNSSTDSNVISRHLKNEGVEQKSIPLNCVFRDSLVLIRGMTNSKLPSYKLTKIYDALFQERKEGTKHEAWWDAACLSDIFQFLLFWTDLELRSKEQTPITLEEAKNVSIINGIRGYIKVADCFNAYLDKDADKWMTINMNLKSKILRPFMDGTFPDLISPSSAKKKKGVIIHYSTCHTNKGKHIKEPEPSARNTICSKCWYVDVGDKTPKFNGYIDSLQLTPLEVWKIIKA